MKPIKIGAIAAIIFVALTTVIYALQNGFQLTQPKKDYTHLHCPQCRLEMAYNHGLEGKPCAQCGSSGPKLVPTVGPNRGNEGNIEFGFFGKIIAAGVVSLLVTLAFVYGCSLRHRALKHAAEEAQNRMLVCRCPFCNRRIGYVAKKRGAGALCPRCKTAFSLTEGEERDDIRDPGP